MREGRPTSFQQIDCNLIVTFDVGTDEQLTQRRRSMTVGWFRYVLVLFAPFVLGWGAQAFAEHPDPVAPTEEESTSGEFTSLKKFPQNLAANYTALFSRENIAPLLIGGAATGIVVPFDHHIGDHVGMNGESTTIGKIGSIIGGPAVVFPTITGLLIGGHYSQNDRFHSFTYSLAQAAVINESLVQGLKFAVGRTRPDGSDSGSFPSGHAATSFMVATVVQQYYGWKAGMIGYSAATFIAFSRSRENKHWVSDLTAGATLGYIVGSTVSRRTGLSIRIGNVKLKPALDLSNQSFGFCLTTASE